MSKVFKKKRTSFPSLSRIEAAVGLNPYLLPFEDVAAQVQSLNRGERARLLSLCESALRKESLRNVEHIRVSAVKVLVALVPDSILNIRRWINKRSGRTVYEVHFSLFCFLDRLRSLDNAREFSDEIPSLVGAYLASTRSETAQAAWMAGDLLGDHWAMKEALPILMKSAKEAKFAAGRTGALHGLSHVLAKAKDPTTKRSIIALLRELSKNDRSKKTRDYAELILREDNA